MKTALVTGGAKGIGRDISLRLAKEGYNVVVNYYTSEKSAQELVKELCEMGTWAISYKCNVADISDVKKMFENVYKIFGSIDVLVNNAGVSIPKMLLDVTDEDIQNTFRVNAKGVINCSKYVIEKMINNGYGRIINISSVYGSNGASCETIYSASKGAVDSFTKALAKEVAKAGITVNAIAPGPIDTDMCNETLYSKEELAEIVSEIPVGRLGVGEDIANVVAFLATNSSSFVTGQIIGVNGGYAI